MSVTMDLPRVTETVEPAETDILAGLVGGADQADNLGEMMIDQSIMPTAGPIVLLSRLANC